MPSASWSRTSRTLPSCSLTWSRAWEDGAPIVAGIKNTSDESWLMYQVRTAYYRLVARLTNVRILAHFTGFGLYDRSVIDKIRADFRDPYPYFRGMIAELGLPVTQIFYNQNRRARGITSQNFYTLYDFAMLGITNLSKIPLRLVIFFGFVCACFSFLVGMFYLVYKLVFWSHFDVGIAPVVLGLFFLGSVQLIALGIIGEYVGSNPYPRPAPSSRHREGTHQLLIDPRLLLSIPLRRPPNRFFQRSPLLQLQQLPCPVDRRHISSRSRPGPRLLRHPDFCCGVQSSCHDPRQFQDAHLLSRPYVDRHEFRRFEEDRPQPRGEVRCI